MGTQGSEIGCHRLSGVAKLLMATTFIAAQMGLIIWVDDQWTMALIDAAVVFLIVTSLPRIRSLCGIHLHREKKVSGTFFPA